MKRHRGHLILLCLLSAAPATSHAQTTEPDLESRVNTIILELQDAHYKVRQLGTQHLLALPAQALPLLDKAVAAPQIEPETRARIISNIEVLRAKARESAKENRARLTQEWEFTNAIAGYKAGQTAAHPWDQDVARALRQVADLQDGSRPNVLRIVSPDLFFALQKVVEAGCHDPLLLDYYIRFGYKSGSIQPEDARSKIEGLFDGLMTSHYSASLKLYAGMLCLQNLHSVDPDYNLWSDDERKEMVQRCAALWPDVVNSDAPDPVLENLAERLDEYQKPYNLNRIDHVDDIFSPWSKARPTAAGPFAYKAHVYVDYAWDGRGGDWAANVTPEQWKLFSDRLAVAQDAAEKAYLLDVTDPWAASTMITACMGTNADETEMEKWFTRAVQADPEDPEPCIAKLNYLMPRWHGSDEKLIAFAHECVARNLWKSQIPLMILKAHEMIAADCGDPNYWKRPDVWNDIEPVLAHVVQAHAGDRMELFYRSQFAEFACRSAQWQVACEQFKILGSAFSPAVFSNASIYNHARQKAERMISNDTPLKTH